jgi:hypothetical protein
VANLKLDHSFSGDRRFRGSVIGISVDLYRVSLSADGFERRLGAFFETAAGPVPRVARDFREGVQGTSDINADDRPDFAAAGANRHDFGARCFPAEPDRVTT